MKKQVMTIMAVTVFFTALAVTSVQAQVSGNMTITIPFDFVVSGTTLPAGKYYLQANASRFPMQIRGVDKNQSAFLPSTHSIQALEIQPWSRLVFNKYGNQYFLSQVWFSRTNAGLEVEKGGRERLVLRELASNRRKAEIVTVPYKAK